MRSLALGEVSSALKLFTLFALQVPDMDKIAYKSSSLVLVEVNLTGGFPANPLLRGETIRS